MSDGRPRLTSERKELLRALEKGSCHRFSDWPNPSVPKVAAGVYTIWENGRLVYVGMSGRGLAAEDIAAPDEPAKAKGLWTRLDSHASGRRSGDQFCVYVCDRFVVLMDIAGVSISPCKRSNSSFASVCRLGHAEASAQCCSPPSPCRRSTRVGT